MTERQTRLGESAPPAAPPFTIIDGFVVHPYLAAKEVQSRAYQTQLAQSALRANTLVVLPTGLGKTVVAVLCIAETLQAKTGSVLLLAPTRPLALQHADTMRRLLRDQGLIENFSGEMPPKKRRELWGRSLLLCATPQTVRNDLAEGRYDLKGVSLLIFDEAHRAVGDYAYVEIARRLRGDNPHARVLGLTASPGSRRERIQEVATNLGVEIIEARDPTSQDVAPYVHAAPPEEVFVELTPLMRSLQQEFQAVLNEQEARLRQYQVVAGARPYGVTKRELVLLLQSRGRGRGAAPGPPHFPAIQAAQRALYATICLEYLETQGLVPLWKYLDRLLTKPDPKRAEASFAKDPRIQRIHERLGKGIESSHPKVGVLVERLREILSQRPSATAIVFAQYRDTLASLQEALTAAGIRSERLIGQQGKGEEAGLSQAQQHELLQRFSRREFPVLLSTSIGEEGLDIPQVDLVVFYEAVPSEIRAVQRRGRTGRTLAGRVLILIARDTRDEAFYRAQTAKETKMRRLVGRYI